MCRGQRVKYCKVPVASCIGVKVATCGVYSTCGLSWVVLYVRFCLWEILVANRGSERFDLMYSRKKKLVVEPWTVSEHCLHKERRTCGISKVQQSKIATFVCI